MVVLHLSPQKKIALLAMLATFIILSMKSSKSKSSDFSGKFKSFKNFGLEESSNDELSFNHSINNNIYLYETTRTFDEEDSSILVDKKDFKYVLNIPECGQEGLNPFYIFLVHTAINHLERRDVIRNSWGQKNDLIRVVFLLGSAKSEEDQKKLQSEHEQHQDIVQGNFLDTYKNLTYKHVMGLKWATFYCPNCKYLVKVDDDTFVNTPYVLKYIPRLLNYVNTKENIVCSAYHWNPIIRDVTNKWYVSYDELNGTNYPTHCCGFAIFYSPEVASKLYKASCGQRYFWVDDAYVSGVLAAKANVTHYQMDNTYIKMDTIKYILKKQYVDPEQPFLFGGINLPAFIMTELWKYVSKTVYN